MKKKIFIAVFIFVLSFFALVGVNAESLSISFYEKTSCVTIDSSSAGGVFYASFVGHYDIINMYFNEDKTSLSLTDDTWIHMKGIVSEDIYRIKVNANGTTCQSRLFDTTKPSNGLIQLNEDRTFEVHYNAKEFLNTDSLNKLGFQIYVTGDDHIAGSHNESIELLGIVFNNEQNYSDWSTPVEREEHVCKWDTKWTYDASNHWHICLNGCKTLNSYEKHHYENGICSECGAEEPGELSFGIMSTDSELVTIENAIEGGSGKISFVKDGTASINIPVENVLTTAHKWLSIKLKVGEGVTIKAYADNVYICADVFTAWNASKYLETYDEFVIANIKVDEYLPTLSSVNNLILPITGVAGDVVEIMDITFTIDGLHHFDTPIIDPILPDEGPISNIILPKGFEATYEKNEIGEQTITYSKSPEFKTFDIKVTEYNPANSILEIIFEVSSKTTVCVQINGKIDWSLGGHNAYPGERTSKIIIDLCSFDYELGSEFTISFYLDSNEVINEKKSITFKSITFKTPEPEPEGMYISRPTSSGMSCYEGALGDEVVWTYGDWASVDYKINKYDKEFDVLAIQMSVISGMNLGIRVNWNEVVDGQVIEMSEDIRNHWTSEGLFTTTGNVELVFLLSIYGLENKDITSVTLYFDPPTNTYIPNEGENVCTIFSLELYKSSQLNLQPLNIVANPMTVDYNGNPINFIAHNECDYEMIVEYLSGNDGDWSTEAPVNAGTYNVRIKFLGSLTHDYSVAYSTLTINKIKAEVSKTDIYVNPETGEVTLSQGIVAALKDDFSKESLIKTGFVVEDGAVIYFYYPEDQNHHSASQILSIVVSLNKNTEVPTEPDTPVVPEVPTEPNNPDVSDDGELTETTNDNSGCGGSVSATIFGVLTLLGVISIFKRKINE